MISEISIVGAGLGGLTLARTLQARGIPATVWELEDSPNARSQGGTLDMHPESGQRAMSLAGLDVPFRALLRPEGNAMRILDKTATVYLDDPGDQDGERPEIDRTALRDLLLGSLADGTVQWGRKVASVTAGPGAGVHQLTFTDGTTAETGMVVGADGAWSRVRPLLSPAIPEYCGMHLVEVSLTQADIRHPDLAALVGSGSAFVLADSKGLLAQRNGDGRIRVYAALPVPADWTSTCGIDWASPDATRTALLGWFSDWDKTITGLISRCDDEIIPRAIYQLPVNHTWPRVPGVTLLGDAAHLMSPFAGEGANLAMLDGAELATSLADHDDAEIALAAYEQALFPRSTETATATAQNIGLLFNQDAPQGLISIITA